MTTILSLAVFLFLSLWMLRLLERTLFHVALWQTKEYRFDRFRAHVNTKEGIWLLLHPWYWAGWFMFAFLPLIARQWSDGLLLMEVLAFFFILLSSFLTIKTILHHRLRRPQWTLKALLLILLTALLLGALPALFYTNLSQPLTTLVRFPLVALLFLLLTPLMVAALVLLFWIPSYAAKQFVIAKAKRKIQSMPHLTVIGITGSFGKSSVKEFLTTLLSKKYTVLKTPKNVNTEIGVAKTILKDLHADHEVFVVEMGAYRRGEIAAICDLVHPRLGIVTGVNEQHSALFGSFDEIKKTKAELVAAIPKDGTIVLNLDNPHTREFAEKTDRQKITYALERPADFRAAAIIIQPEKLSFSLIAGEKRQHILVSLLGEQNVSNLLAAIAVADKLGMTLPEIAEAAKAIEPLPGTMKPYHHPTDALIIDDSYNANPDGVIAALEHLQTVPRKNKVLVMMPMIELGKASQEAHERIGEKIGEVCDSVIITKKDYFSTLQSSAQKKGLSAEKVLLVENPKEILERLKVFLNPDSVILLENRIPRAAIDVLLS